MGWLSTICEDFSRNQEGQALLQKLEARLKVGLAFIGEDHTRPYARAVVCDLMSNKLIRTLFVEDDPKTTLDDFKNNNDSTLLEKKLQALAAGKSDKIKKDIDGIYTDDKKNFQSYEKFINDIPMAVVFKWAIRNQVSIYFHDVKQGMMRGPDPQNPGKLKSLTSQERIDPRNRASAEAIQAAGSNANSPNTAVLIGADHFRKSNQAITTTIQDCLKMGDETTFDFSKFERPTTLVKKKKSELKFYTFAQPSPVAGSNTNAVIGAIPKSS